MASAIQSLARRGIISPPPFVVSNLHYECLMGSLAYGVASDASDQDIYGFCIPPKDVLFPHLAGVVQGFGHQGNRFDQFMQHHVIDQSSGTEYDFTIYNIVKYFQLCMECNPNMIDSLFVPENCIKHATQVGQLVRDNRRLFLSKLAWPKFKGYAYSQVHKIAIKQPQPGSKREQDVLAHGYDTKFAYHVVRLLDEVEQILEQGDIDLQRNREQIKAIRRGDWTEEAVRRHFDLKVKRLEALYEATKLPIRPDEAKIKRLLMDCLEAQYGNLSECVVRENAYVRAIRDIAAVIDGLGGQHADGDGRDHGAEEVVPGDGQGGV